ncbi:MAG: hypothetical protein KKA52_04950 [Candidatus Omnitrophica bacterium]|nr:hypothetical protein [Candidatus Omnitrophota bacterium]
MRTFTIITTVVLLSILSLSGYVFAGSISWRCPECGLVIDCDPRQPGYLNSLSQQHLSSHQSSGTGTGYGYSGGGSGDPVFDACMPVLQTIFQSIGQYFADTIFGTGPDPEQQRRLEAEQARLRAEQEVAAREEARRKEEQHQKLMSSLKNLPGSGTLSLKTISDTSQPLALKGLPNTPLSASNNALESLRHAAYLSKQAALSNSADEAAFLSEQAFLAAEGEKLSFNVPDVGPGMDVTPEELKVYTNLRTEITQIKSEYSNLSNTIARKHNQQKVFQKAKQVAEDNVKKQEEKINTLPEKTPPEQTQAEKDKLAEAQKLLEEATRFEDRAKEDLEIIKQKADETGKQLSKKEEEHNNFIKQLGKNNP